MKNQTSWYSTMRLVISSLLIGSGYQSASSQTPIPDKISGEILAHQKAKQQPPGRPLAAHQNILRQQGLNLVIPAAEEGALYVTHRLTAEEMEALAAKGIRVTPDLWIPPVPGKHLFGFHLATVDYASLDLIRSDARFQRMESTEIANHPLNDLSNIMINADDVHNGTGVTARTGAGVKIAIADSGVDLTHADLPVPVEAYDVTDGVGISNWGINVANRITAHGTHVSGTVLGRGTLSGGRYKGAAPGASFYFYKIGNEFAGGMAAVTNQIAAINRSMTVGANIFTMSYGGFSTYMDGSESMEQAIDAAVAGGMTVFIAAGNNGTTALHDSISVAPGTTSAAFGFAVVNPSTISTYRESQQIRVIWRDGTAGDENMTLACTNLTAGETLSQISAGSSARATDAKFYFLTPNIAAGGSKTYTFTLQNTATSGSTPLVHCYRSLGIGTFTSPDSSYVVTSPAIADGAIAVGAWTQRKSWIDYKGAGYNFNELTVGTLEPYSSFGPRIDGVMKPEIVAPGSATISLRDSVGSLASTNGLIIDNDGLNRNGSGPANYYILRGTTMACSMAAGAAALMLENNPSLTPAQVRQKLNSTALNSGSPNNSVGYGLINVQAALLASSPAPTISTLNLANSSPSNASTVNWTLVFSSTVTGVTAGNFSFAGTAAPGASIGPPSTTNGGLTWNVPVATGPTGGSLTLNLANTAGQSPTTSTTLPFVGQAYTIDKTAPTVAVTPTGTTTNSSPITFTLTFSEFVTGLTAAELIVTNGTKGALSGSGLTYTIPVTPVGQVAVTCKVPAGAAQDAAVNNNTVSNTASMSYDTVVPTVAIGAPSASSTQAGPVTFPVTYSDTNFSASTLAVENITLNSTGTAGGMLAVSAGTGSTRVVTLSGITGDGTLGILIAAGTASDMAGNTAPASGASTTFSVDNTAPMVTPPADLTEEATGSDGAIVTYSAATATDAVGVTSLTYSQDSGTTFPLGTTTVTVTAKDAANNTGTASFTVMVMPLTPIQRWREQFFGTIENSDEASDLADPNHNGIVNLLEYALGGDPVGNATGTAMLPQPGRSAADTLQVDFNRHTDRTDLNLTLQASDSLAGPWTDLAQSAAGAPFVILSVGATAAETGSVTTRGVTVGDLYSIDDPAHLRRFMRLHVAKIGEN